MIFVANKMEIPLLDQLKFAFPIKALKFCSKRHNFQIKTRLLRLLIHASLHSLQKLNCRSRWKLFLMPPQIYLLLDLSAKVLYAFFPLQAQSPQLWDPGSAFELFGIKMQNFSVLMLWY